MQYKAIPRTCYPCPKIEEDCYDWWSRHALKKSQAASGNHDLVFIGDSITHFWHNEQGMDRENEQVWHEYYGKRSVLNLGCGYDRPQNVLYRLEDGELQGQKPKLIVLHIGTNCFSVTERYSGDDPETAVAGIRTVCELLFELAPGVSVLVMEIFPRLPETIQEKINRTNALLRDYAAAEKRIILLSIHDRLTKNGVLNPDLFIDKCCHPNKAGYRLWADALEPYLRKYGI